MKSRIFFRKQSWLGSSADFSRDIELEVNDWLAAHPAIKVIDIKQSSSGGSLEPSAIAISIWYDEAG
jgi:hypothetical protein